MICFYKNIPKASPKKGSLFYSARAKCAIPHAFRANTHTSKQPTKQVTINVSTP